MSLLTSPTPYDGKQILLDGPVALPPETNLLVAILPANDADAMAESFYALGKRSLARAYDADEPDYSDLVPQILSSAL